MQLEVPMSFNKGDINKMIRDWINENLEIRCDAYNKISIGYMRESLFGGERVFHEVDSCQIAVPIHVDNMRFGG